MILSSTSLEVVVVLILFIRVFFDPEFVQQYTQPRFYIYTAVVLLVELFSSMVYLNNKPGRPRAWRNYFYLAFMATNPWFYE
jgi:hypothetical protein